MHCYLIFLYIHINIYKMVFSFTKDNLKILITLYEQYPDLYNVGSVEYKNKYSRTENMKKITEDFNRLLGDSTNAATVADVANKIKNLRTQFFKELNNIKKSKLSGKGTDEIYKPSWYFFSDLHFLSNSSPVYKGKSNLLMAEEFSAKNDEGDQAPELLFEGTVDEFAEISMDGDDTQEIFSPTESSSRASTSMSGVMPETKKRKRMVSNTSTHDLEDLVRQASDALTSASNQNNNSTDTFGMMVSAELSRIKSKKKVTLLKRKILNIIYDALDSEEDEDLNE